MDTIWTKPNCGVSFLLGFDRRYHIQLSGLDGPGKIELTILDLHAPDTFTKPVYRGLFKSEWAVKRKIRQVFVEHLVPGV